LRLTCNRILFLYNKKVPVGKGNVLELVGIIETLYLYLPLLYKFPAPDHTGDHTLVLFSRRGLAEFLEISCTPEMQLVLIRQVF
jgi:hypothetical protein